MEAIHIILLVALFNVFIMALAIFIVVRRAGRSSEKKINAHWQWLSEKLGGLEVVGGEPLYPDKKWLGFLRSPLRLEGVFRNCNIKIYNYVVGSGKNSTTYSTVRIVGPNPKGLSFHFHREGIFSKIGKTFGMQDIQTGDMTFDKMFIIKASDPDFIKVALLRQIKNGFYDVWEKHGSQGTLALDGDELQYNEVGTIRNEKVRERFAAAADLLVDLRGTVEFYNSK